MRAHGTRRLQWAHAEQRDAFNYGPAPLCLSGGFGGAKTLCATRKILYISDMFPGNRGVIARRVGDELRKTTMPTFFKDCPPEAYNRGGRRADQEKILRLNPRMCEDGVMRSSEILFLHLDDPEIQHILRGLEINWFLLDQAEEMEEEMFDTLLRRLGRWDQAFVPSWVINREQAAGRSWAWWNTADGRYRAGAKPIPPTYGMITVNPDLETHWVWRRFHEDSDEYHEKWKPQGYRMFTFNPLKNRFLPAQNRAELLSADPEWQARFVYGKWGAGSGTIHKVAEESIIQGTPEILEWILTSCTLFRVLDHGDSSPTCCLWWGVDQSGNCYCVAPETRILRGDLRWARADSLAVGDELPGFDEEKCETGRRRWRRSRVIATERIKQPCYRLALSDGTVVTSSSLHRWLCRSGHGSQWRTTEALSLGDEIVKPLDVWDSEPTYDKGYIAGAFDGEGHLTLNNHGTLTLGLAQKDNELLGEVEAYFKREGIRYSLFANRNRCLSLYVTRKRDILKVLGSIRPKRLLPKFDLDHLGGFRGYAFPVIVGKEFVGVQDVIAMKTSTGTFIAEGLASHNCYREYYQPDKLISEHRHAIWRLSGGETPSGLEHYTFNLADPQIFYKTLQNKEKRYSVAEEYTDTTGGIDPRTAIFWMKADNEEMGVRNRINEYLRVDPTRIHPFTKKLGSPRMFFLKKNEEYPFGCSHAIRELKNQRKEKIGSENGKDIYSDERDEKIPDHAYDCVRYFAASRPPVYTAIAVRGIRGTALEARMMLKRSLRNDPRYREHRAQIARMRGY